MYVILYCQLSHFILRLPQPICVFTAWANMSLQKRLLSSASSITLSLFVLPNSLNNLSVFKRDTILLIFTVAALTFFLSMYHRLGGILSGSYLISFTTLINSSFSSSLYFAVSSFFTNISSSSGNEQM